MKKTVRRIQAGASGTRERIQGKVSAVRERIRGRISAKRDSDKAISSDAPTSGALALEAPALEVPASKVQASEDPVPETPASETPALKAPASQVPASEIQASEVPVSEASASETPVFEAPLSKVPISKVPISMLRVSKVRASKAPVSKAPRPAASAVLHQSDQVEVVPRPKRMPYAYSDTPLFFITRRADDKFKGRVWLLFGAKWESFEKRFLADMRIFPPEVIVDRRSPCPFNWLPLEIRAKIWKYAFDDCQEPVFLKKDGMVPKIPTCMRFVSYNWMSEAWFAWINALSNRTLVLMDFARYAYLDPPCPVLRHLSTVRCRAIKIALGDNDPEKAEKRTRQFLKFITRHKTDGFLAVRTLIVELRKNWTAGGQMNEVDLADLLMCGAFIEVERIRIHGEITNEGLEQFLKRARRLAHASF
ncbi:hypothetical protein DTO027I6_9235 [Penicillium roqueforti]|uniref:uncharacterized protein n=1 Tax=Penicillium roqueforti TaxID=5082 RepID=UPI00190DFB81|nr:uncharacterized protein LCP9604111_7026 [Penicillium roqueforti]KAF9245168.1 hypothetical protein LCP9604111_7026 [Penicillium roqueforti]KAI2671166.1 hypothetical protein CBS147355_8760 [Penicillium roqueforti]KAI2695737.1 hypothetical protein CBS147372_9000 [Penicillium roqueforti]KAI2709935.1 hypothetical protein CBS147318_8794 [Penicillium roqueforti]KAI2711956.1 hypothetical protein CBS147332_5592 [Penicillium roqueforti]